MTPHLANITNGGTAGTYQITTDNFYVDGTTTISATPGMVLQILAQTANTTAASLTQFANAFQNITFADNTFGPTTAGIAPPPRRRQPPLPFNRYVNASDLLEEFIAYAGAAGVRQGEVLALPVELFVKWLVIRACEEDQESSDVTLELSRPPQPRCLGCQRWMGRRDRHLPLHDGRCAARYFARRELVGT